MKDKRGQDEDYRIGHQKDQARWRREHPEYWRHWRLGHVDYVEANRCKQRDRDRMRREKTAAQDLAKVDALFAQPIENTCESGRNVSPCPHLAKVDAILRKLIENKENSGIFP